MSGKPWHTAEQKLDITTKAAVQIAESNLPLETIANSLGISPQTFDVWSKKDEAIAEIYFDACTTRAYKYYTKAVEALESIEDFWTDHEGKVKERQQSVNKCKFQFESYRHLAADLAPEKFGERAKELRELLRDMEEIKRKLDDKK